MDNRACGLTACRLIVSPGLYRAALVSRFRRAPMLRRGEARLQDLWRPYERRFPIWWDRGFESAFLQRRVFCEPDFLDHRRLEETAFFDPVISPFPRSGALRRSDRRFRFTEYQLCQSILGVRNPDYYHRG